ncbi:MAG: TOBE domain-containing protein [Bacillales bacterium]
MVESIIDYEVDSDVGLQIKPDGIHIMEKDFVTNIYTDAYINNSNQVMIDETPFDCDVTQLIKGSHLDEDGYLIDEKNNKKYDLKNATVIATIDLNKIEIIDDIASDECQLIGEIVDAVYVGDHYRIIVRTENEEDFVLTTPYTYNLNDKVGIKVKKEDIRLQLKKEVVNYEI